VGERGGGGLGLPWGGVGTATGEEGGRRERWAADGGEGLGGGGGVGGREGVEEGQ
jgi:hypothetical protein